MGCGREMRKSRAKTRRLNHYRWGWAEGNENFIHELWKKSRMSEWVDLFANFYWVVVMFLHGMLVWGSLLAYFLMQSGSDSTEGYGDRLFATMF